MNVGAAAVPVLALLLLVGCGGQDESAPRELQEPQVAVSSVEDLLVARLDLPGDPDWLAADHHGLWVKRDDGRLTLIDPATNEEAGSIEVGPAELCAGIGSSFGALWTCSGPDVVRVDPRTFEVVARLEVNKQAVQGHLVGGFGRVWVITGDGSSLIGIDPATNAVATEFDLPARCTDVALAEDALWLPCKVDDRVLKIDPGSGETLLDLAVDNPTSVAVDTDVWVSTATMTVQLDPETGDVLHEAPGGSGVDGAVTLSPDAVWVRHRDDFLTGLDRETGETVRQIDAEGVTSGGDVLVLDGDLWTTAYDDRLLFRIDPSAG